MLAYTPLLFVLMALLDNPGLVAYVQKVDKCFREELDELNPWWMLNAIPMVDVKGVKLPPGACAYSLALELH